jgi:GNAT superfamily N-acetyltransferase
MKIIIVNLSQLEPVQWSILFDTHKSSFDNTLINYATNDFMEMHYRRMLSKNYVAKVAMIGQEPIGMITAQIGKENIGFGIIFGILRLVMKNLYFKPRKITLLKIIDSYKLIKYRKNLEDSAWINLLFVNKNFRRSGVASLLFTELVKSFSVTKLYVDTYSINYSAINFYKSRGFKRVQTKLRFSEILICE